ncbi:MAG: hypothetical protein U9O78_04770 [Patescibacteria group bacterium]|nr:hypothetical protein [Patescibacteria group bacterium]
MNKKFKQMVLPLAAFVLTFSGLVATYALTKTSQDIRQQAYIPDYNCEEPGDCGNAAEWYCIDGNCLPKPDDDECPSGYSSSCSSSDSSCGYCVADKSRIWINGDVCQAYCIPKCNSGLTAICSFYCSPCGNDKTCNPEITEIPPSITSTQETITPTQPENETPTPTEPVIGPQCHELHVYFAPGGQIDLNTGALTGSMDSQLDVGTEVVFRCSNSINGDGNLPSGYSYKFRVYAPCPDNPSETCLTEGNSINPTNNGSLSQTYVIGATGAHSAQCAVCDQTGSCDWEN